MILSKFGVMAVNRVRSVISRLADHYSKGNTCITTDEAKDNDGSLVSGLVDFSALTFPYLLHCTVAESTVDSITVAATDAYQYARVNTSKIDVVQGETYTVTVSVDNLFNSDNLYFSVLNDSGSSLTQITCSDNGNYKFTVIPTSTKIYFTLYATGTAVQGSARWYNLRLLKGSKPFVPKNKAAIGNSIKWATGKTDIGTDFVEAGVIQAYDSLIPIADLSSNYGNQIFFDFDYQKAIICSEALTGADLTEAVGVMGGTALYENKSEVVDHLTISATNAADHLYIPNGDNNSDKNTHPKVLDFVLLTGASWNGYRYWMAYTPFPGGENPNIAVSNDKTTWTVPVGLTNPLDVPVPGDTSNDGTNSDTHLVYREDTNTLEMWWRRYSAFPDVFYRRTTIDGVSWTAKEQVFTLSGSSVPTSPAVLFDEGKYKMWAISGGSILYYESELLPYWTLADVPAINWGTVTPWHLDVIKTDLGFEMLVQAYVSGGSSTTCDLYYVIQKPSGRCTAPSLALHRSANAEAWDYSGLYRSSFIKNGNQYEIYYSGINGGYWYIGLTTGTLLLDGIPYDG